MLLFGTVLKQFWQFRMIAIFLPSCRFWLFFGRRLDTIKMNQPWPLARHVDVTTACTPLYTSYSYAGSSDSPYGLGGARC